MRVLSMHRTEQKWEDGQPPGMELVAGMGRLMGEMGQAGVLVDAGGLRASALGVRLNFEAGERRLTPGPFTGNNELPAGFAMVRVRSIDEAVDWATRFADLVGDVEIDIRPVTEPWDIGAAPKPAGLDTTRYMLMHKADASFEADEEARAARAAAMATVRVEMEKAGVFVMAVALGPSSSGQRLRFRGGECRVTDGPFAESKELVAGFCLLEVQSLAEAAEWSRRFAAVTGDIELDNRVLHEPAGSR